MNDLTINGAYDGRSDGTDDRRAFDSGHLWVDSEGLVHWSAG